MTTHQPGQIGTHDAEGWRTHQTPGDVCLTCSDAEAGHWVPVSACPEALAVLDAEHAVQLELGWWSASALDMALQAGLWPVASPRRRRPSRPCRWCPDRYARPATHVSVWPREPVWTEDGPWLPPRRVRVCAFHGRFATNYPGVRLYRFRKV